MLPVWMLNWLTPGLYFLFLFFFDAVSCPFGDQEGFLQAVINLFHLGAFFFCTFVLLIASTPFLCSPQYYNTPTDASSFLG